MPDWKILKSEVVIDTPHLRLRRDTIELPQGSIVDGYHVRETRGFVMIFAMTPEENVVLVRQYKHGIGEVVLELPAGMIDHGESATEAALRELGEETGYAPRGELEHIQTFIVDPTNSDGRFALFLARDVTLTTQIHPDPTEDIAVELVPLVRLIEVVRSGEINVCNHVGAIYVVLDRLGRL
ncbi:MAG: NUDIX hydrolase [Vulcanimicrobiaceae bacterium]